MTQTDNSSFEIIKQLWAGLHEPLHTVNLLNEKPSLPNRETVNFLSQVGFPESADPDLDFTDLTERLFTHTQLYVRDDFPALDDYLVIGATGDGNPICIDVKDSAVLYVDHDNGFESVFINSSLAGFSFFLASYKVAIGQGIEVGNIGLLRETLYRSDPAALAENSFWARELLNLERSLDNGN